MITRSLSVIYTTLHYCKFRYGHYMPACIVTHYPMRPPGQDICDNNIGVNKDR
jgi:hypothetical protein